MRSTAFVRRPRFTGEGAAAPLSGTVESKRAPSLVKREKVAGGAGRMRGGADGWD